MALQRKISEIYLREQGGGGWKYRVTPNDFEQDLGDVNWNSPYDTALDGSLRQNFRGFRSTVNINWEKLTSSTVYDTVAASNSTLESLLDDIVTSLATNKDDGIGISFDNTNWDVYVPESLSRMASYTNQIGRSSGDLSFKSQQLIQSIPSYLEGPTA